MAGLLDWVGDEPPNERSIAQAQLVEVGHAHIRSIQRTGGEILGERDLIWDRLTVPDDINRYWGDEYVALRAERRFVLGDPPRPSPWARRDIGSPLTDDMLAPFPAQHGVVQFSRMLTFPEFARVAEWLREYPQLTLRAYGSYDGTITDLEFLKFFPFLRRFSADALYPSLGSLDGLRHLPEDAEAIGLGRTKHMLDLGILRRFHQLKSLYLEGQKKGIGVLAEMRSLEELTLRSITLPDLSLLLHLEGLLALDIKLGGTKDLSLLPAVGRLRYLELWRMRV